MDSNLKHFTDIILNQATVQKKNTEEELAERRSAQLEEAKQELEAYFQSEGEKRKLEISEQGTLQLAQRETELYRKLLQGRSVLVEELFSEVEKRVRAFTETEAYKDYIKAEYQKAIAVFAGDVSELYCSAMQSDFSLLKALISDSRVKLSESETDIIGGFILQSADARLYADCSLKSRIEEERERFASTGELMLKV